MNTDIPLERALAALGDLLAAERAEARIVVVGGAALNLLGIVKRTTRDIDVIALATDRGGNIQLRSSQPFPPQLARLIITVARDLGITPDWMNAVVAGQWQTGLPPGMEHRLTWRIFGGLHVGLAGRPDLVSLKLYAAADQTGPSRHTQDLIALRPTDEELEQARQWIVATQDPGLAEIVPKVIDHVRAALR